MKGEKLTGFYAGWFGNREFPLDMAGFAFSLPHYRKISKNGPILMPFNFGYQEDGFLRQLQVPIGSVEILAPNEVSTLIHTV